MVRSEEERRTEIAVHRYYITLGAVVLLLVHSFRPNILPADAITIALLIAALFPWIPSLFPWIPSLVSSAEFPFGWKVVFRELKAETVKLQKDVDALQFLITSFVSQFEIVHLTNLAADEPFLYERGDIFINELVRLWNFGLIELISGEKASALWNIPPSGNLKDYVKATQRGKDYLKLRKDYLKQPFGGSSTTSQPLDV